MTAAPAAAEGMYGGAGIGAFAEWKVFAGYEPVDHFALELAYEHMDDPLTAIFTGETVEYRGVEASVLGFMPVGRNSVYGRIGSFSWSAKDAGKKVASGTDAAVGFGYQFGSVDTWRLRVELETFIDVGGILTVSAEYRFSGSR